MKEAKLGKKYDFYEYNSELLIPKENFKISSEYKNTSENTNLSIESEYLENNNLKIEDSTFIIKAPETNQILIILSIDKDLPPKIDKNIYSIALNPIIQEISFMHESQNESIIISTGSKNEIDKIQVFQIQLKQLLHEAIYNLLKDIKNAVKIIPIKDNYVLILHISTEHYKNGGLKLWKNFKEEIYNFNKIYNFAYNFQNNKIICIDNNQAPFIFSIYAFDESYFNNKNNDILQPEFFIQVSEHLQNSKEEIESFLHFESFCNLIIFWAKIKKEKIGYSLGIFFVSFKEKKCFDSVEFNFDENNKYFFKINKNTNEIYIFNLSEELLYIYNFKTENQNQNSELSPENLFITKIKFSGNIKGIDFTANNGMVVLTEQNNLVCYSRNEYVFQDLQKKYKQSNAQDNQNSDKNNQNIHPKTDEKLISTINNLIIDKNKEKGDLNMKKYHSEKISNKLIKKSNEKNEYNKLKENENDINNNKNEENNNRNNIESEEDILKKKEEEEKIHQMLIKQTELIDKLKLKTKEKSIIKELANSLENKLSKFMENILSNISKEKLEEVYNQIGLNKPEKVNINKDFDIILMESMNFIFKIQSLIPDIYNTKNKILYFLKNEINRKKLIDDRAKYNCDFESLELINKSINGEKKENSKIKSEVEKLIYNCSLLDNNINKFSEMSSNLKNFQDRINLLLLKCKNDINQINEMYKYNKIRMSKEKETELINILITPFIECFNKELKEYEQKLKDLISKENKEDKNENNDFSIFNKNNNIINKYEKDDIENKLSFNLMNAFEKNNFYSLNNTIIKNRYINLDEEFE